MCLFHFSGLIFLPTDLSLAPDSQDGVNSSFLLVDDFSEGLLGEVDAARADITCQTGDGTGVAGL